MLKCKSRPILTPFPKTPLVFGHTQERYIFVIPSATKGSIPDEIEVAGQAICSHVRCRLLPKLACREPCQSLKAQLLWKTHFLWGAPPQLLPKYSSFSVVTPSFFGPDTYSCLPVLPELSWILRKGMLMMRINASPEPFYFYWSRDSQLDYQLW